MNKQAAKRDFSQCVLRGCAKQDFFFLCVKNMNVIFTIFIPMISKTRCTHQHNFTLTYISHILQIHLIKKTGTKTWQWPHLSPSSLWICLSQNKWPLYWNNCRVIANTTHNVLCKPVLYTFLLFFPHSTTGCCFREARLPEGKNMQKLFQLFVMFTRSVLECFQLMCQASLLWPWVGMF